MTIIESFAEKNLEQEVLQKQLKGGAVHADKPYLRCRQHFDLRPTSTLSDVISGLKE